jgi:hypothetical protein
VTEEQPDQLAGSLAKTVENSGALEAAGELAKIGLDSIFESDLIAEIPVVSTIAALCRLSTGLRERIFLKKISRFLCELRKAPEAERAAFAARLDVSPEERTRVAEALFILLDRLDDLEKAELLARAFAALLKSDIDHAEFKRTV